MGKSYEKKLFIAKDKFSGRTDQGIFFIGNILDKIKKPIYVDWAHLGRDGNIHVAKKMVDLFKNAEK